MKKVIMTVAAFALLAGTGAGAYLFLMKPAQASESEKKEESAKAEGEGGGDAGVSFVQMSPLTLPILDKNGVSQIISIVISIEAKDEVAAKEVERLTPRLKDAYIQDMYGVLTKQAAMTGGVIQVGYIKNRLNQVTAKVMGKDKVNSVLLQVVQQRPV